MTNDDEPPMAAMRGPAPATSGMTPATTSGLATFLMTDIEGSTRLWEEATVAMTVALEAHDAILRVAVESHGGTVVKTTGDGLIAHFDDPVPAVAAAVEGQRALTEHEWPEGAAIRARMAVHSGSAQARGGDYFGPALNRVARLLAIGHGGQVLLSGITATLVGDRLPEDAALLDRGDQRLRDLDQPVRVFELAAPGLARDFAPLRTAGPGRSNLPQQLTSFVGRERELADVRHLLEGSRLVTLIGTGGTGKTRLMLEVAAGLADEYPDGVWLTELAPVADPGLVTAEVARALNVQDQPQTPSEDTLADFLRAKSMLLLLDNCEHLISAAATLAESLLEASPSLTIMATGREALGIPGEAILQVPSLSLPAPSQQGHHHAHGGSTGHADPGAWSFEALAASDSVRLFTERATAVAPAFELTPANAPLVAEICQRLDGIPLAIELAAARVPVLSVGEILQRLGDRFRLLTGGRRTAMPRQQTLQALVDWSWDLLPEEDRRLLRRLSVFAGGWSLAAAASVCGSLAVNDPSGTAGAEPDTLIVLDALTQLVERSLVVVEPGPVTRYRLLETIRQYARDRLVESGETDAIRTRHLAFILDLAERAERHMRGPELIDWLQRLDADADNVRLAIEWGLESEPEAGIRLCVALWMYWRLRSVGPELEMWFDRAVEAARSLPPPEPADRQVRDILVARTLSEAAFAGATWMNRDACALADEGLDLARATGDLATISHGLTAAWTARLFAGKTEELVELGEEAIEVAGRAGDPWAQAMASSSLAGALTIGSSADVDLDHARSLLEGATRFARMSGDEFAMAFVALIRGRMAGATGRIDEARAAFQEAAAFYDELGDDRFALVGLSDLGHAVRRAGELDEALAILRRTLPEWEHSGNRGAIANQLESFGFIAVEMGEMDRAAHLLGAAMPLREDSGAAMLSYERAEYDAAVVRLRASMGADSFEAAWAAGRTMTAADAVAFALEG